MKLNTYEDWKHCITVSCGILLTAAYIDQRLADLTNVKSDHTKKFVTTWGDGHRHQVIAWFERARQDIG